ncbi:MULTISPECIES: YciI family protein [unclassified Chelatococcus]|uniref:YciI family protein n=1 Tax=unclassified Chelatococcus TaxID=2638111 RepID=UPI001BCDFD48|nr:MULTISPECIES: YciI family protein [unclassified Chelatococcus]MBS7743482.1 hypothetical protein [Chelatococcus sp. HY11]MBX3547078.1 hypothetical protein [Chelatococcus sp.]CAH1662535.1 YciI family protein [Hyphomicrobiales bacterium]CAH1687693.1 YciI family protein [Hyphomicrobiales bacterium]
MPYAIIFFDRENSENLRLELRSAHIDYIRAHAPDVLASGGLLTDDGNTGHGGVIIIDTDDRRVAEDFVAKDPFFTGGIYGQYWISRWRKAFFAGQSFL